MADVDPRQSGADSLLPEHRTRRTRLAAPGVGDPRVTYTGPAAIWWIPKPRGPRVSLVTAAAAWLIGLSLTAATMLWSHSQSSPLWPFGRPVLSSVEILLRYEIILLVCLAYVTLCSLRRWVQHIRVARHDARAIDAATRAERWETAGLLVHRYCLMVSAIWRRVPALATSWDEILRQKLPRHRRLYVYYRGPLPSLPTDPTASFTPAVMPPPHPSLWSAIGLVPVGLLLYWLVLDVIQRGYPQRIVLFNAVLLGVVLLTYGSYFLLSLLGRSNFFRFAPGVAQLVKFGLSRRRPKIETYDLRQVHAVLDLSSRWPGLTLLDTPGYKRETFRLPRGDDVIEAVFRASLSTAPTPPLPEETLVD